MGFDLGDPTIGLGSFENFLAKRKADAIAAQHRRDVLNQQSAENDYKNRALDLQSKLREDALTASKQNQENLNADRVFKENTTLAEGIRPGGDFTEDNPITGRLRSVGAVQKTSGGMTLPSTQMSPGEGGGMLRTASSGVADASIPNHYTKLETQKQYGTRMDDERQTAKYASDEDRLNRTAAETNRHNLATEATARITANKPAAGGLITVQTVDAQGNPVTRIVPKTAGAEFAARPNATTANRLDSAKAVNQVGNDMIAQLSDPQFAAQVGPALGRYNTLRDFIGNPPPEFAQLAGSIESYALANMGVHGMRSAQGAQQISKLLDQHHTPASMIATIRGLNGFSEHFLQNAGRSTGAPTASPSTAPTAAAGPVRIVYDMNGNPVRQ